MIGIVVASNKGELGAFRGRLAAMGIRVLTPIINRTVVTSPSASIIQATTLSIVTASIVKMLFLLLDRV